MGEYFLQEREFEIFRGMIYREAGIKLSDMKKALVQARLSRRIRALGLDSYAEYLEYLIEHYEDEKISFINCITTNKTDFFRENIHFEFIRKEALAEIMRGSRREIRAWSAGCSTGEEAYSLAMTLREYFPGPSSPEIKILATDIDTQVLEKAMSGVYTLEQVQGIDVGLLKKYFCRGTGRNEGLFRVKDSLRRAVSFARLNLQDETFPMKKPFDIIFCRNVIIYFDRPTQKSLFEKFSRHLDENGYLFIGHSENISNISDQFSLLGNTIYRKTSVVEKRRGRAACM